MVGHASHYLHKLEFLPISVAASQTALALLISATSLVAKGVLKTSSQWAKLEMVSTISTLHPDLE